MRFNIMQVSAELPTSFKVLDRRTGEEVSTNDPRGLTNAGWLYRWMAERIATRLNYDFDTWARWYGVDQ